MSNTTQRRKEAAYAIWQHLDKGEVDNEDFYQVLDNLAWKYIDAAIAYRKDPQMLLPGV